MSDKTMLKRSAHQKVSTVNPGTIADAKSIKRAFITKVKRPSVTTVIGSVRRRIIGFIKRFITPRTTATARADKNPSILTPGRIYAVTKIVRALTNQLISISINLLYYFASPSTTVSVFVV